MNLKIVIKITGDEELEGIIRKDYEVCVCVCGVGDDLEEGIGTKKGVINTKNIRGWYT